MPNFDPCLINVPHKDWVRDFTDNPDLALNKELQNWVEVERWARRLKDCGSACDCGATLLVNFNAETVADNGSTTFTIATVDPDGYGYTGVSPSSGSQVISWDGTDFFWQINQMGLYSVQGIGYVNAFSTTAGGAFQFAANRFDIFDGWFMCVDNDSNVVNSVGGDIRLNPSCQPYPMPSGSQWYWAFNNAATGGSCSARMFFVVTKVGCCSIPVGPT